MKKYAHICPSHARFLTTKKKGGIVLSKLYVTVRARLGFRKWHGYTATTICILSSALFARYI